jgi:hypothetical protein
MDLADAYETLGLEPPADREEVGAAYRALAKLWHPDIAPGPEAVVRMIDINEAHETVLAAIADGSAARLAPPRPAAGAPPRPGDWLPEATRRALGRELVRALDRREPVRLVTAVTTWASPSAVLAVTDRRLLWLHDDAVLDRVRSLRFSEVEDVERRLSWPRRRRASVRVRTRAGRRLTFADLAPTVASQVVTAVRGALTA